MDKDIGQAYWYFLKLKNEVKIIYEKDIIVEYGKTYKGRVLLKEAYHYFFYTLLKHMLE